MTGPFPADKLSLKVKALAYAKVLCFGDVMLDRFVEGSVSRISPESPTPVFKYERENLFPGGAANVARNICALGGVCTLIGVVGHDAAAVTLAQSIARNSDVKSIMVTAEDRPTTVKTRFVVRGQHMLRVDQEVNAAISPACERMCLDAIAEHLPSHDVLILSDYAKGLLTDKLAREAIALAHNLNKMVVVDPKSDNLTKYAHATIITPNAKETQQASGIYPDSDAKAKEAGRLCLERSQAGAMLITRSEQGMTLVTRDGTVLHIVSQVREVFDVVGAGDTVIATLGAALACGLPMTESAYLANTAAGVAVGKRGTATVSPDELVLALEIQYEGAHRKGTPIMLTPEEAERYARIRRMEGKVVGFTNGCFDILHPGHISLLKFARDNCDCLIVGLNSDTSVKRLKGPARPFNSERDRSVVLSALGSVDAVVIFGEDTPYDLIRAVKPDVLIKGADYSIETVVGADVVMQNGGKVLLVELVPDVSSTKTIEKAKLSAATAPDG
jgi:D-beta-D-heptose 7-phosphate kinase/D-beta-D-heptose 1-phosphate adenosyltransferase